MAILNRPEVLMTKGIGDKYHEETKYARESLGGGMLDWAKQPDTYKQYPDSKQIELPSFDSIDTAMVKEAGRICRASRNL